MKSATRVLAMIALGGGVAGAAIAVSQVPAPQAATTVAVSGPGPTEAVQQLADESSQLDVAIASAQTQLAQLNASAASPAASPNLADLLAQAQSQLAIARQRLAADEALLAKLHAVGQPPPAAAPTHQIRPPAPSDSLSRSPADQQPAQSTPTAVTPTWQRTQSSSPRPTNRGGDD
jgi:hypothetical protein